MSKLIGFIIFVSLIVVLYNTCPTKEAHSEALADVLPELINEKFSQVGIDVLLNNDNPLAKEAFQDLAKAVVDVDDYLLFSIGRENFTQDGNVVSFGIGGSVFTVNDEIFQKASSFLDSAKEVTQGVGERLQDTLN